MSNKLRTSLIYSNVFKLIVGFNYILYAASQFVVPNFYRNLKDNKSLPEEDESDKLLLNIFCYSYLRSVGCSVRYDTRHQLLVEYNKPVCQVD